MPIYEYKCDNCGESIEKIHKVGDDLTECPLCGYNEIKKVISSGTSFRLKGKGWYETDFKNG